MKHHDNHTIADYLTYRKGFRMVYFKPPYGRPKDLSAWINFLWGFDVFFGNIPFLKTLVLLNAVAFILLALVTGVVR